MAENQIRIKITVKDDDATKRLGKLSAKLVTIGHAMEDVGRAATIGLTAPIVAAFTLAVKESEELKDALEPIKTEFKEISQELGDALVPVIKEMMPDIQKLIGFVADLVEKFAAMDTDSKMRVIKFTAAVAALGPVLSIAGKLMVFAGTIGNIASALGAGVGGAAGVGAAGAAAGGGATAAVAGFGTALSTVILPLTAVIALGYGLIKMLDKIGALSEAKGTIQQLGILGRNALGMDISASGYQAKQPSMPARSGGSGGSGINVTVNAPNVVGTEKALASALRPSIYEALRQLRLA